MSKLDKTDLADETNLRLPDNITGDISAEDVRNVYEDYRDSLSGLIDDSVKTGTTTISAGNAYSVNLDYPSQLTENHPFVLKINITNSAAAATLQINALTAKPLCDLEGNDFAAGDLLANTYRIFSYDATLDKYREIGPTCSVLPNTDSLPEGLTNLYYTDERVRDEVAAFLQPGTNVSITHDDPNNTLTIDAEGSKGSLNNINVSNGSASFNASNINYSPGGIDTLTLSGGGVTTDASFLSVQGMLIDDNNNYVTGPGSNQTEIRGGSGSSSVESKILITGNGNASGKTFSLKYGTSDQLSIDNDGNCSFHNNNITSIRDMSAVEVQSKNLIAGPSITGQSYTLSAGQTIVHNTGVITKTADGTNKDVVQITFTSNGSLAIEFFAIAEMEVSPTADRAAATYLGTYSISSDVGSDTKGQEVSLMGNAYSSTTSGTLEITSLSFGRTNNDPDNDSITLSAAVTKTGTSTVTSADIQIELRIKGSGTFTVTEL